MHASKFGSLVAAFAAGLVHASGASASVTTWQYGSAQLQYLSGTPEFAEWLNYPSPSATAGASPIIEGIEISGAGPSGQVFSLSGSQYISVIPGVSPANRIMLSGTGTLDDAGWRGLDYFITTQAHTAWELTGGQLYLDVVETEFMFFDAGDSLVFGGGSGDGGSQFGPGTSTYDFLATDVFLQDYPGARQFTWSLSFWFEWTGFAPADTLSFALPGSPASILTTVPATGAGVVIAMGALMAARRRRA